MKRLIQKISRKASPSPQSSARRPDESSSAVSSHSKPNDPDPLFLHGRHGLFRLDRPLPLNSNDNDDRFIYNTDIVFIHGLNGDPETSWSHDGVWWPRDLLPHSMPGARIFSYGYPSKIFSRASTADVRDFSKSLLAYLKLQRADDESRRPIIYICHSMGGIVLKQAMILAWEFEEFSEVWLGSKGIIFMGTPHRGSDSAAFGKVLGDIANAVLPRVAGRVNTTLIAALEQESRELLGIADSFVPRANAFRLVSFYETEADSVTNKVVVGQSSATLGLPNESRLPMFSNHRNMCRYSGETDQRYVQVSRTIQRIAKEVMQEKPQPPSSLHTDNSYDELEKMCVSHLNSMDIAEYEARLARPIEGTLEWVRDNPEYIAWMSSKDANLLWVTGYAGCGKTTMAAYIVQCLSKYPQPNAIVCRFFCDNKNEEHQNATILLRSLIFQIVDRRKKLVKLVRKASDSGGMQIFDRFDALWNLFVRLVQAERTFRISVVIDAIDECDESTQKRILDRISELLALGDSTSVKFFITSRPDTPTILAMSLSSTRLVRLALEQRQDKISHDVNLVIHHRVNNIIERGGCKPSTGQKIADLLIAKADKTFLWVSLVLPQLEARRVLESPDIFSSIERLGTGVALIYTQFLSSIPEEDQALAARMLRLLVVSAETLTSDEFGIFLAIDHKYKSTTFRHDSILFDAKTAQAALGPLVRVSDSKIELAHLTLKEYLLELSNRPNDPLSKIFGVDLLRDTVTLATACISYLLLDEFQGDIFSGNSPTMSSPISMAKEMLYENEDGDSLFAFDLFDDPMFEDVSTLSKSRVEMLRSQYGLFHHAAVHWATYYTRCEDAVTTEQEQDAIALYETQRSANWFRYYWYERHSWDSYPSNINPLMISAYFGHTRMLQRFLSEKDYEDRQIVGRALYWAARQGHAGCVESILLYHEDIGDYYDCTIGESPLGTAAQYGNQQCLFEILRFDRVDVNLQNAHGRTPISLAAANDHEDVVTTLLSREDILVDLPDKAQSTPFLWAVSAGSIRVVSHFLSDKRVNKEHTDISGRNALSYAAGDGTIEMVENLLKSGMINPGSQDIHGRTPLSYAAQYGQYDIVRALVKSGRSNISARDKDGRIALSWAARQGDSRVLHYLLKREVSCARIPDANGWLPLAWALDPPGYPDNIRILLQSMTAEEVNRKDDVHGRTTLSWTAAYGYLEITRHLVSFNGIDLEAGDNNGRTPLSYAAGNGNVEVAKALIQTERVQVDSRDENGRTPLSWAAAEGQCPMVEFLLTCPGVDALSTDNIGRTPVDYASLHGYDTVVQVLEEHANRNVS